MTPAEEDGFTAFVHERGGALLRYARMLVAGDAEAEDVLQVALLRLTRHWPKRLDAPEAYARRAILNVVRDRARRRHLVPVPSMRANNDRERQPDDIDVIDARARLDELLSTLPPRQRAAVVLRLIEGLSEAEAAAAMGCSAGTVKSNLSRGLAKLRVAARPATTISEGAQP